MFAKEKSDFLSKEDKSSKKSIDKAIKNIIELINKDENYFTTSSCSGRIVVLNKSVEGKERNCWIYKTHEKADFNEIKKALNTDLNDAWLKAEPFILHIRAKTIEKADKLLSLFKDAGIKTAGITGINKIMIQAVGNDRIDSLLAKESKIIVDDETLKILIQEANNKLERNLKRIKEIEKRLSHMD